MEPISYRRHRFPPVTIQHAVRLYYRFTLSHRDVEDVLAERGTDVSCETVRRCATKYGTVPSIIVTDKWRASRAAIHEIVSNAQHVRGKRLNSRAENSHQPTRRRERKQQRFKSPASAPEFLSTFSLIYNHFNIQRHLVSPGTMRKFRAEALHAWMDVAAEV